MGNCNQPEGQYYGDDNTIDAYAPEQKNKQRERTQNETSMKFMSQTADEEGQYFGIQNDDYQKLLEMPKKMIRKPAPKFESTSYQDGVKKTSLDDYAGKYLVLFFYPYDFNKQFQDEIIELSENADKFKKLNCELLGCSIDSHFSHMNYINKPRNEGGLGPINFPLMADVDRKIAGDYGVLVSGGNESGSCLRSTFIIDNKLVVRHLAINDFAGHLKADEILRMVKGIQDVDKYDPKSAAEKVANSASTVPADKSPKGSSSTSANATLYDKIGGEQAITSAVNLFYKKMLADARVSKFFKSTDMTKQEAQQTSFLCSALGGPKKYIGKNMKDAHQNMRLTNTEFDVTVEHLINTLKEMNVNAAVISEISKLVETLRKDIVFAGTLTIYEQLGGDKAMEAAVDIFYKRMLEDPKVSSFFKSTDMVKQREQQKLFLSMALGGPKDYKGKNMKDAHKNMNLTNEHFDVTVSHLVATLKQLKVDEKIISQIGAQLEPLRKDIVQFQPVQPTNPPTPSNQSNKDLSPKSSKSPTNAGASSSNASQNNLNSNTQVAQDPNRRMLINAIGGEAKIEQLVGILMDRIYADGKINMMFTGFEPAKMKERLKLFLIQLTGGAKNYKGKNLRDAHSNIKINDVHFNIFMNHLRESLKQMAVEPAVYHEFCGLFESFRVQIVTIKLSIFDRLGGEPAIALISSKLCQKILVDEAIKEFFVSIDINRLKEMLKGFLMMATGGPSKYSGKTMRDAHQKIKINDIHFNAFKGDLLLTLKELLVDPQTFLEISGLIETQRSTIVTVTLPLLDRLGGDQGVLQIVNRFYDRILLDPRVKQFFQGIDMARLRKINHQFIMYCVKGASSYTGKNMKEAHAQLALNDTHFNLIKDHLLQSIRDCSKDPLSMNEIGNMVEGLRNDIVSVKVPLFQRIGGDPVMKRAVERFYQKAQADARLKDFFKNVDMNNLRSSNTNFLTMVMGGVNNYKGKNMKEAHAGMKITDVQFNTMKEHISQSFRELGVDNITIQEIARIVESTRKDIVSVRPPLFERIGGEKALQIMIEKVYEKITKNATIGSFFQGLDPTKQKTMLKNFFSTIFGGQPLYKGKKLKDAHAHIRITDVMFNEFRGCFEATLKEMNMNPLIIKEVAAVIDHFRKEVVIN